MEEINELLRNLHFEQIKKVIGVQDKHLNFICEFYQVKITYRGQSLNIICDDEKVKRRIYDVIAYLIDCVIHDVEFSENELRCACQIANRQNLMKLQLYNKEVIAKTVHGKIICPKSLGQAYLYKSMKEKDIVFALGVAGTGKTYLSVMYAVSLLKKGVVEKIILTRPAVEAGENLGFLPGDLKEKVDPYLRPLYDALHDALGVEQTDRLVEKGVIEIAPLAYMRGRTLENAFIILDEAQNATKSQLKMFLTRMGFHSKIVVTGDATQVDLIKKRDSALSNAKDILSNIKEIEFIELTSVDVVRHPIVQKIINAYEKYENE